MLSPVGAALLSWAATLVGSAVCNSLWSYSNAGNFVFLHACALFLAWFFAHCTVVRLSSFARAAHLPHFKDQLPRQTKHTRTVVRMVLVPTPRRNAQRASVLKNIYTPPCPKCLPFSFV